MGRALDLYRELRDRTGEAHTHHILPFVLERQGRYPDALEHAQAALDLFRASGERGYALRHLGEHDQAIACYQRALDLFRTLGDRTEEATTLAYVGDTHEAAGDRVAAVEAWRHALVIYEDLDHPDAAAVRAKLAAG